MTTITWTESPTSEVADEWSEWRPFPDPRRGELLVAPIGAGAYEVRQASTKEGLMLATANCVAARLSGLLPTEIRPIQRETSSRRQYLARHIDDLEYRVLSSPTRSLAAGRLAPGAKRRDYRFGVDL